MPARHQGLVMKNPKIIKRRNPKNISGTNPKKIRRQRMFGGNLAGLINDCEAPGLGKGGMPSWSAKRDGM